MKVLVNLENTEDYREFDVDRNEAIEMLKYIIEAEFNIPYKDQEIFFNGSQCQNDQMTMASYKINENDILVVRKAVKRSAGGLGAAFDNIMKNKANQSGAGNRLSQSKVDEIMNNIGNYRVRNECQRLKNHYKSIPSEMSILLNTDEELATAILSENDQQLEALVKQRMDRYEEKKKKEHDEMLRLYHADSNDVEAQKRIEEINRLKAIDENLEYAQMHMPESFSFIHMLYIPVEINKIKLTALVDTGAQTTIMSVHNAEKCGLSNLIDKRYAGIAKGVGTSKIVGVIHAALIKIENKFIPAKISVIENISIGFIFGLDNMRSHRCMIDLKVDSLIFPDADITVKFLSDGEIKKNKELEEEEIREEYDKMITDPEKAEKK